MAIIAPQTAPNYAVGDYHRILSASLHCAPDEPVPHWLIFVGHYASEAARDENPKNPMWVHTVQVSFEKAIDMGFPDPRDMLYTLAMNETPYYQTNAVSDES